VKKVQPVNEREEYARLVKVTRALRKRIDNVVLATPSGETRNVLAEANILLGALDDFVSLHVRTLP
jgi:hypothetical protein